MGYGGAEIHPETGALSLLKWDATLSHYVLGILDPYTGGFDRVSDQEMPNGNSALVDASRHAYWNDCVAGDGVRSAGVGTRMERPVDRHSG